MVQTVALVPSSLLDPLPELGAVGRPSTVLRPCDFANWSDVFSTVPNHKDLILEPGDYRAWGKCIINQANRVGHRRIIRFIDTAKRPWDRINNEAVTQGLQFTSGAAYWAVHGLTIRGPDLAMCAARPLADRELAAEAYALIEPYAELPAMVSLGVACFGSVHHALGVAAFTMKDRDRAVRHLTEAIARDRALGHWPAVETSRGLHAQAVQLDSPPAICIREGQTWRFTWAGRSILVPNRIGMLYLAVLVANPGTEIPAAELAMGVAGLASAQPVLDAQALRRDRKRMADLQIRIGELDRHGDHALVAEAHAERDVLMRHLTVDTGIGRRSRTFSGDTERAHLAVGKAIRRALSRLTDADPMIGDHLNAAVHTGVRCSYRPEVRGGPVTRVSTTKR